MVGVLVLVDQQMLGARLPAREYVRIGLEQPIGLQQQIVEIERIHFAQPRGVEPVDLSDYAVARFRGAIGELLGIERFVLGLIDLRANQLRAAVIRRVAPLPAPAG